jgi:ADP-ribose pyrophosphatase YjhB (NUDIX family)
MRYNSAMEAALRAQGTTAHCPVVFLMRDRQVLFGLRNYTADTWKAISVWTCPGGRCDEGETIEDTVRREVQEETGITDITLVAHLGVVEGAKQGDVVPVFVAHTTQEPRVMEPHKFSEWRWCDVGTCAAMRESFINPRALALFLEHTTHHA